MWRCKMYQIKIYKKMLTPNYGCVDATDKFTTVSLLYLSCFSIMWTIVQLFYSCIYHLVT